MTEIARLIEANEGYAAALREDVAILTWTGFLGRVAVVAGSVFDVESGRIDDVVRWERPA